MTASKSNEILSEHIEYIKEDIRDIKEKLDTKYVSHETFEITLKAMTARIENERMRIDSMGKLILAGLLPVYGAVIGLLFKIFTS